MDKRVNKKSKEELQQYLMWRRRGSVVLAKKGKGAKYNRQKIKVKTKHGSSYGTYSTTCNSGG